MPTAAAETITLSKLVHCRHNRSAHSTYHNLILHRSITNGRGWGRGGSSSIAGSIGTSRKVVGHIRVELIGGLLGRAGAAAATLLVGGGTLGAIAGFANAASSTFSGSSRLGLRLGLTGIWVVRLQSLRFERKVSAYAVLSANVLTAGMTLSA